MSGLSYEFTDKEVSRRGGLRFIEEVYPKSGLKDFLENECTDLPVPGHRDECSHACQTEYQLVHSPVSG